MPIPWEISAALAGSALLVLAVIAGLALIEIRRTLRSLMELSAATDRHLPAILQNLDEINRNASELTSSVQKLSSKATATGERFDEISRGIHLMVESLETDVIQPGLKAIQVVSTLLAFGAVLRRIRHPLSLLLIRGKGRA